MPQSLKNFYSLPAIRPIKNQDGSIIVIALLILAIMAVIGLMSSDTVVTENFIIRNAGIYKQNVNLVEAAAMEALQEFIQIPDDDPDNFDIDAKPDDWLNDQDETWTTQDWYKDSTSGRFLKTDNSRIANDMPLIKDRGENGNSNLRYAFVGWETVSLPGGGSESLVVSGAGTQKIWRKGRILVEYISLSSANKDNGFGGLRMEIGVKRRIPIE